MVLAAQFEAALDTMRRVGKGCFHIAEPHLVGRQQVLAGRIRTLQRGVDRDRGRPILVFDLGKPGRSPCLTQRLGGDGKDRLADILHDGALAGGWREDRVVAEDRRIVVLAGNVVGRQHRDDARRGADREEVHAVDAGMGPFGHGDVDLQRARQFRVVVDVAGRAGDVLCAAVMGDRCRDAADNGPQCARRLGLRQFRLRRLAGGTPVLDAGLVHHCAASASMAVPPPASGPAMRPGALPDSSSRKRSRRFCAVFSR